MRGLRSAFRGSGARARFDAAAAKIDRLPAYQVALWPDGWELLAGGAVRVCDTHAMAEARRWYALAERNRGGERSRRLMARHGVYVPREVVDLVDRRFPSEQVASVALQLLAGDWIRRRRQELRAVADQALCAQALGWSGSRHQIPSDREGLSRLLAELVQSCVAERLIPDADYRIGVRVDDGYGLALWRCRLQVALDPYARARVAEALEAALIPWNRAVVRDGKAVPVLAVEVRGPGSGP